MVNFCLPIDVLLNFVGNPVLVLEDTGCVLQMQLDCFVGHDSVEVQVVEVNSALVVYQTKAIPSQILLSLNKISLLLVYLPELFVQRYHFDLEIRYKYLLFITEVGRLSHVRANEVILSDERSSVFVQLGVSALYFNWRRFEVNQVNLLDTAPVQKQGK